MIFRRKPSNNGNTEISSISQGTSLAHSNFTILNSRESLEGSRLGGLIAMDEYGDFWSSRAEFVFATLLYCLNIGNLWRFPTQAMRYGEGAFVYVYIVFSLLFGIPLLFFEVALGQYTNKGLMRVFRIIPIAEGVSWAMVFLCNTLVHVYNMIGIFNYIYLFSFARTNAPLSGRSNYGEMCFYENRTNSLENLHFLNEIVMVSDDLNCAFNVRNLVITFVLWLILWAHINNEYSTKKYFTMVTYLGIIFALIITLISTVTVKGAAGGIIRLLSPPLSKFASYQVYLHAFEQSLISLGLGMGPLINFGSHTTFRAPILIDTIRTNICTLLASIIMIMIVFGAVGIYSIEQGYSDAVLEGQEYYLHVLLSKLFGSMPWGYRNFNIAIFYLAFFMAAYFSTVKYTELLIQFIHSKWDVHPKYNTNIILMVCAFQFIVGCGMVSYHGLSLLYWSASNIFTVFSVMTLIAVETIAMSYIYRMKHFCEDVEFMIGREPNIWYLIIWYSTPFFCLAVLVGTVFEHYRIGFNWYDGFCLVMYIFVVLIPVICHAIYSYFQALRKGRLSRLFYPREVQTEFQDYILNYREPASTQSREL